MEVQIWNKKGRRGTEANLFTVSKGGGSTNMPRKAITYFQCLAVLEERITPFWIGKKEYDKRAARRFVKKNQAEVELMG